MSKLALDLLRSISLLNKDNSIADLSKIPDSELRVMLSYYHQKRSETAVQEIDRLIAARLKNAATLSSISAANSVTSLCSKLLVRNTLVTSDPLYDFAAPTPEHTQVEKQALGFEPLGKVDLGTLHNKLLYFSGLSKNIEAGFHEALPLGLLHKPPEQLPVNFPKNLYREQVPPGALSFVQKAARIRALRKEDGGFTIADNIDTSRSRQICVSFDGDESVKGASVYFFRDVEVLGQVSPTHFKFAYKPWSEEPLDQDRYDRWIEQITNQTVGARIKAVASEMHLADLIDAPYVTESSFEATLLAQCEGVSAPEADLAIGFLEANRGLLAVTDPDILYRLRTDNEALFERFRLSIEGVASQLQGLAGESFELKAKILFESEIEPQIEEVNDLIGKIEGAVVKGGLLMGSTLVLALLTGAALPVAAFIGLMAAGTATEAVPAIGDYMRSRSKPQFIWHKIRSK